MNQVFDIFNNPEKPQILLTKPTGEEIFEIGTYDNFVIKDVYNDVSEISFVVYRESTEDYDEIKGKKYLDISGYGIYIVDDVVGVTNGLSESKQVVCKSVDFELSYKHITLEASTYQLYDIISPDETLMKRIIDLIPSWSIGSIDTSVADKYRYFDVEDKTILEFLYSDLEDAYQAVVEINYETRTINIVDIDNVGTDSDIYISHDNLVDTIEISEVSNEIVTALSAYGGNNLDIRDVNPSGTNTIYNFDYFKTTEWMSQELIDALDDYEILYDSKQSDYTNLLADYSTKNEELLNLQTDLSLLQNDLTALETLQREVIQGSTSAGTDLSSINNDIVQKNIEISSKENEISNKKNEIDSIVDSLLNIVDDLSFENNFTQSQIEDLDKLTIEYTYQNDAYIITDGMTEVDIQEQSQLLFDDATEILYRLSQPRFSFDIDVTDFLKVVEYQVFIEQFELATIVNLELQDGTLVETRLISYEHDWDNNKLRLEFTSKYRTNDPTYLYNELYNKSVDAGVSVSFSKSTWYDYTRNDKDDVTTFINSALDASVNNLISTENQDIIIDSNGLRGRQSDGSGGYLDDQIWITNNLLAFTNDGWNSAKLALGKIEFDGVETYGLIAETIVGNLIAGNELRISNSNNNFVLDSSGATLTNASFTMDTTDGKGRIILDPDSGIRIQSNKTGSFSDVIYLDTNGDAVFEGTLQSTDGIFTGTLSGVDGTFSGTLQSVNGVFTGTLDGVDGNFTGTLSGNNVLAGSLDVGDNLSLDSGDFGGSIRFDDGTGVNSESYIYVADDRMQFSVAKNLLMSVTGDIQMLASDVYIGNKTSDNIVATLGDLDGLGGVESVSGGDSIQVTGTTSNPTVNLNIAGEPLFVYQGQRIMTPYFGSSNYTHVDSSSSSVVFRRTNGDVIGILDFSGGTTISSGSTSTASSGSSGSSSGDDGGFITPSDGGAIA